METPDFDFEELVEQARAGYKQRCQQIQHEKLTELLMRLKKRHLHVGSRWARSESPEYVLTVMEVYPSRIKGINPSGHPFSSSAGSFLREFFPVDACVMAQLLKDVAELCDSPETKKALIDVVRGTIISPEFPKFMEEQAERFMNSDNDRQP